MITERKGGRQPIRKDDPVVDGSATGSCLKGIRGGMKQVAVPPKWGGKASERIADVIVKEMGT